MNGTDLTKTEDGEKCLLDEKLDSQGCYRSEYFILLLSAIKVMSNIYSMSLHNHF